MGTEWPTNTNDKLGLSAPYSDADKIALVDHLQAEKTQIYMSLLASNAVPRPGVLRLMDEALADPDCLVGITSASTKEAVVLLLKTILGDDRTSKLDVFLAGDDVDKKKPDPQIYNMAIERLQIDPKIAVVIEDSKIGLMAAKGAGCNCLITTTTSTNMEPFYATGADAVVPDLDCYAVTLDDVVGKVRKGDRTVCDGKKNAADEGAATLTPEVETAESDMRKTVAMLSLMK